MSRDREALRTLYKAVRLREPKWLPYNADQLEDNWSVTHERSCETMSQWPIDFDAGLHEAATAIGIYYTALQAWEDTDDYPGISKYIDRARTWLGHRHWENTNTVVLAAVGLLESLIPQMETENARFCACPTSMASAAGDAAKQLEGVKLDDSRLRQSERESLCLLLLTGVLRHDQDNDIQYLKAIRDTVAPLAERFVDQLTAKPGGILVNGRRQDRGQLTRDINARIPELEERARRFIASGETFGGGLRAQVKALEAARDSLALNTLLLGAGRVLAVYPFALDLAPEALLAEDEADGITIGLRETGDSEEKPVTVSKVPLQRTDAWSKYVLDQGHGREGISLAGSYSARLRPSWTSHGDRPLACWHDLDLVVVLGTHDHYVRIQTPIGPMSGPDRHKVDGIDQIPAWSGHDVDQWVRRLTRDAGKERIEIVWNGTVVLTFGSMYSLAESIVAALAAKQEKRSGPRKGGWRTGALRPVLKSPDLATVTNPLGPLTYSTMIFLVDDPLVLTPQELRPLKHTDDLSTLNGIQALTTGYRYLPVAVEEWAGFAREPGEDLLAEMSADMSSLFVNGEVVALIARSSPNWIVIEQLELLEFAITTRGRLLSRTNELQVKRVEPHSRREWRRGQRNLDSTIIALGKKIDDTQQLLDSIRSRELVRSPYHRKLLDKVLDAFDLSRVESRVISSLSALEEYRTGLEESRRHRDSMRLDKRVEFFTSIALFVAIDQGISAVTEPGTVRADVVIALVALLSTVILAWLYNWARDGWL